MLHMSLYGEYHYSECHYAECHYAECRYAECRGAFSRRKLKNDGYRWLDSS